MIKPVKSGTGFYNGTFQPSMRTGDSGLRLDDGKDDSFALVVEGHIEKPEEFHPAEEAGRVLV